jgi:hypothetical protein
MKNINPISFVEPHSQPYKTGDTVKDTLHGTDYQINVLILYDFSTINQVVNSS